MAAVVANLGDQVLVTCVSCETEAQVTIEPFDYGEPPSAPADGAGAAEGRSPAPSGATGD